MIFKKLELKNFKSHVDTTIDFDTGITLVVGENGAGKSSIFEAITYALFKESKAKMDDLVRNTGDASERVQMEVKLTFESHGNTYRVERIIVKKNNSASSKEDILIRIHEGREEKFVEGATEVKKEISQILNMNHKTFTNAVYIKQGEISKLVTEGAAYRERLVSQLLRLNDLEKAYEKMPDIIHKFELKRENISSKTKPEAELHGQLQTLNEERDCLIHEIDGLKSLLEELEADNEAKANEKTQLDEKKRKLDALNIKLDGEKRLLERLDNVHKDLTSKLDEITENEEEMAALKPSTEKLPIFNEFKECLHKFNQLKMEEASKKETLGSIAKHKETLSNEKENHDRYVELGQEIKELTLEETRLSSQANALEETESNLKGLQSDLNKYSQSLDNAYDECKRVLSSHEIEDIDFESVTFKELEEEIGKIKSNIQSNIAQIDGKINENNNKIGSLKQEIKSSRKALKEISEVETKCPTCKSDITPKQKEKLINDYGIIITRSTEKIKELDELIDSLNNDKTLKKDELAELESVESIINTNALVPSQINKITNAIEEHEEKISQLKAKQEKLKELAEMKASKTDEFKRLETSHKNYLDSETLLNNLDDEDIVETQIRNLSEEMKEIKSQLNSLIDKDTQLSLEIDEADLNKKIEELAKQTNRYIYLEGLVENKAEYERKINENEGEIKTKANEIGSIEKTIEGCDYDSENHDAIAKSVDELRSKITELKTNIGISQTNLANNEEKIKDKALEIQENEKHLERLDKIDEYIGILVDFRNLYGKNGIQKDLRLQSRPLIQKYTRDFFEKFNFNYSGLKLNDDYSISIFGPKGEVNLDMVSGGETIAIALSLRLAITSVMSEGNIETILLDEPTIHLDAHRRQELIDVLESMSVIPQMIIVTHDEELESASDTLIKVVKEDGNSKVIEDD